jgi:hypothetical protein
MSANASTLRWPALAWLALSQLFYLVLVIPWLFISMMSVMAFDSGVSAQAVLFVGAIWSYPAWLLIFSILAWVAYVRRKDKLAAIFTTVPLLIVILAVALFFVLAQLGY